MSTFDDLIPDEEYYSDTSTVSTAKKSGATRSSLKEKKDKFHALGTGGSLTIFSTIVAGIFAALSTAVATNLTTFFKESDLRSAFKYSPGKMTVIELGLYSIVFLIMLSLRYLGIF